MKHIKYKVGCYKGQYNPETGEVEQVLTSAEVSVDYSEANEEIAKREAYNGEYTIEDDGQPETYQPSIQEQLDAQAAAIMELMGVVYNG